MDTLAVRLTLPTTKRVVDFHHQAIAHGGRTTKNTRGLKGPGHLQYKTKNTRGLKGPGHLQYNVVDEKNTQTAVQL